MHGCLVGGFLAFFVCLIAFLLNCFVARLLGLMIDFFHLADQCFVIRCFRPNSDFQE